MQSKNVKVGKEINVTEITQSPNIKGLIGKVVVATHTLQKYLTWFFIIK